MNRRSLQSLMAIAALVAGIAGTDHADAGVIIASSNEGGGAIVGPGITYQNFDSLPLGSAGGILDGGKLKVSFTGVGAGIGKVVGPPPVSGQYAPPFLSGDNGDGFGPGGTDQALGPDATHYLTSGISNTAPPGSAILEFSQSQRNIGFLWGSVDAYNTLNFYDDNVLVGTITGTQALDPANGNQGVTGTRYVNFTTTLGTTFNKVVATSSQFALEFDNLSYGVNAVPEPATAVMGLVAAGILGLRRRMKKSQVVA